MIVITINVRDQSVTVKNTEHRQLFDIEKEVGGNALHYIAYCSDQYKFALIVDKRDEK